MPSNPKTLPDLLTQYIKEVLGWDDTHAEKLGGMIASCGRQADMKSVRKHLNVVNNFYTFLQFNPQYEFKTSDDLIVSLLVLKEAWLNLYEELIQEAMKNRADKMRTLADNIIPEKDAAQNEQPQYTKEQRQYLEDFLIHPFPEVTLSIELLKYPTLA